MGIKSAMQVVIAIAALISVVHADPKEVLIKEVVLDSAVVDILYLGKQHECVLVTTKLKRLYYSKDGGKTWTETTNLVDKNDAAQIQVEKIFVNPTDKSVAILQTNRRMRQQNDADAPGRWYPYIYISEDSGATWRRAWGKHHGMHNWISHPTQRSWALVSWWSGNCNPVATKTVAQSAADAEDEKKPCVHRLMVTTDLGKTFLQIGDYIVQFSWGTVEAGQTNRVYFTAYRSKTGDQGKLSLWTQEVDFKHIDFSRSGKVLGNPVVDIPYGNKFLVSNHFVMVAKVKDEAGQVVNLMVSKDGAKTFHAALLPSGMGELEEAWYTILDTSEGAVILHISNDAQGLKDTGRIFVSDADGWKFSQSLVNSVRSTRGECEFDKIVSLQGVYMANMVVPNGGQTDQGFENAKAKAQEDLETASGAEVDVKHNRGGQINGRPGKASKEERTIRTVISFDKGGVWNYLKPPRVNSLGKPYECAGRPLEDCALHLHGTTSWDYYAPFYSSESSVGIIMGTGNVGSKLRFEAEETSTFLSRDGGLTWLEAHQGAYIYEFGDHGGLIVMADDLKMTTTLIFTWNEGQSWYDFKVSPTPFEVDNIITEPNVTATTFIMFGTRSGGEGVLYWMNFDTLGFPACTGTWAADSVSSDYETWKPSDGSGTEACILGQQITYTRRKRTSQCWNGEKFERPVVQKSCACTQANYMCDLGFVRTVGSTECKYGGPEMMPSRLTPTACAGSFSANAYRKVASDVCEGGWTPAPVEVPCPSRSLDLSSLRLFGLVAVLLAVVYYWNTTGGGKNKFAFEVSASRSTFSDLSPAMLMQLPAAGCSWVYNSVISRNTGFGAHPNLAYQKVKNEDFDFEAMDGNCDNSLDDFIAQADYDDAPREYDGSAAAQTVGRADATWLAGGISEAKDVVPKLQAPAVQRRETAKQFSTSTSDEQDLL